MKNSKKVRQIVEGQMIMNQLVFERQIGHGQIIFLSTFVSSFGSVWKVRNNKTQQELACKVEVKCSTRQLQKETKLLGLLNTSQYYPELLLYGQDSCYNYMFITLFGENLDQLRADYRRHFDTTLVNKVAFQMITILQDLHSKNIIHRDIKPTNIVIDYKKEGYLKLIDFGLAKEVDYQFINFINQVIVNNQPIPFKIDKEMVGTIKFASINALLGYEQSFRDDLESLFYTLLYLLNINLPWFGWKQNCKVTRMEKVLEMKRNLDLNEFKYLPKNMEGIRLVLQQYKISEILRAARLQVFAIFIQYQKSIDIPDRQFEKKSDQLLSVDIRQKKTSQSTNHYDETVSLNSKDLQENCSIDLKILNKKVAHEGVKKQISFISLN